MTAIEFAQLLKAKRVGRDKWIAMCPVHEQGGKHRPSLSIAKGRKTAIVFKCMSAGCTQKEILDAMGLTWQSILGDRDVTKEMRRRWADERKLEDMEHDLGIVRLLAVVDKPKRKYWDATERNMKVRIQELRSTLYPEETALRLKRERVHATIETYGVDAVLAKFLSMARGQLLDQQYGVTDDRGRHILPVADHRQDVEAIIRGSGDTSPAGGDRAALANPFRPRNE